jgi:hypothetical protein
VLAAGLAAPVEFDLELALEPHPAIAAAAQIDATTVARLHRVCTFSS